MEIGGPKLLLWATQKYTSRNLASYAHTKFVHSLLLHTRESVHPYRRDSILYFLTIYQNFVLISWREAHSSTGRLVTGGTGRHGTEQKTKLSITRSIFELEARNFAWK